AEDHAVYAAVAVAHRVLEHAQAAPHLHGHLDRGDDLLHRVELRPVRDGGVEVHQVQPRRALRLPPARDLGRVRAVDLLLLELALLEADHLASAHVDGGHHDHAEASVRPRPRPAQNRTKFSTRRSPTSWLFSGWNCIPSTAPRPTTAGKSRP